MANESRDDHINIRVQKSRKATWKNICSVRNISMTSFITDSVENRMLEDERKRVIAFIENQDNIFIRIENNINQLAKTVNGQKYMSVNQLTELHRQLQTINKLKEQQNQIFLKIYSLIANDC